MSKRTPSQAKNIVINVFESIQSVNIHKDGCVGDETLLRHINSIFRTLQGINVERINLNMTLTKKCK